jgi:hypothetical protein
MITSKEGNTRKGATVAPFRSLKANLLTMKTNNRHQLQLRRVPSIDNN